MNPSREFTLISVTLLAKEIIRRQREHASRPFKASLRNDDVFDSSISENQSNGIIHLTSDVPY